MCYDKFSHIFRMNYNGNLQCTGTGLKSKQTKIDQLYEYSGPNVSVFVTLYNRVLRTFLAIAD